VLAHEVLSLPWKHTLLHARRKPSGIYYRFSILSRYHFAFEGMLHGSFSSILSTYDCPDYRPLVLTQDVPCDVVGDGQDD